MSQRQINLENQREVALIFRKNYPAVEQIRFTQEGGKSGFGAPWTVNAVVTLEGKEYQQILGTHSIGGEPLPRVVRQSPPSLIVTYSDGSWEVIE